MTVTPLVLSNDLVDYLILHSSNDTAQLFQDTMRTRGRFVNDSGGMHLIGLALAFACSGQCRIFLLFGEYRRY